MPVEDLVKGDKPLIQESRDGVRAAVETWTAHINGYADMAKKSGKLP